MDSPAVLVPVEDSATCQAAETLIREYLQSISDTAIQEYRLTFDVEAMVISDLNDESRFFPLEGRFYVVRHPEQYVGVGCLKRLTPAVAEIQRMYIQPSVCGLGAGRLLVEKPLSDARTMHYQAVRLESLPVLSAAHTMYRSIGFKEIEPYLENSMKEYQSSEAMEAYRSGVLFMNLAL